MTALQVVGAKTPVIRDGVRTQTPDQALQPAGAECALCVFADASAVVPHRRFDSVTLDSEFPTAVTIVPRDTGRQRRHHLGRKT